MMLRPPGNVSLRAAARDRLCCFVTLLLDGSGMNWGASDTTGDGLLFQAVRAARGARPSIHGSGSVLPGHGEMERRDLNNNHTLDHSTPPTTRPSTSDPLARPPTPGRCLTTRNREAEGGWSSTARPPRLITRASGNQALKPNPAGGGVTQQTQKATRSATRSTTRQRSWRKENGRSRARVEGARLARSVAAPSQVLSRNHEHRRINTATATLIAVRDPWQPERSRLPSEGRGGT